MIVASFVISCLALVAACAAAWYARRQAHAAEQATIQAQRSADLAAEVVDIERERRADEVAEADRLRVHFELEHLRQQAYVLRNTGTDCAYGVQVEFAGPLRGDEYIDEFAAGDTRKYTMGGLGSSDHVVVTWHYLSDQSDPPQSKRLLR